MTEENKKPLEEEAPETETAPEPQPEGEKTAKGKKKKEKGGITFTREQVEQMELAAKQLSETDYRVIDVAENCGFHNHSYFTRVFRKKYNKTPLAYRRTTRSGGE